MKKIISIMCCCLFLAASGFAQEEESGKKPKLKEVPEGWLPQAGDWAVSIDATPLLEYLGNALNGTANNTLDAFGGTTYWPNGINADAAAAAPRPNLSIMGKYMLSDELALRANIGVIVNIDKRSIFVRDDLKSVTAPLENARVKDYAKISNTGLSIALGAEYRVGKRKVQGIFGGSLFAEFNKAAATFSYGNAITEINQAPSSNAWGIGAGNINATPVPYNGNNRMLKNVSNGMDSYLGVIGHVGIEWFFAPKVALGGEVNLSLYGGIYSKRLVVAEAWNPLAKKLDKWTEVMKPKAGSFHVGTENIGANVFIHFYF